MNLIMICLEALEKIISKELPSKEVINEYLKKFELAEKDKSLFQNIIIGIINNLLYLEFLITPFIEKKRYRLWFRPLLYLTIYRIVYLQEDQEQVISESIEIAKIKDRFLSSTIRIVLNEFIKTPLRRVEELDEINYLSIKYSYPAWLVAFLLKDYSYEEVENILKIKYNENAQNDVIEEVLRNINPNNYAKILDLFASSSSILFELARQDKQLILDGVDPLEDNIQKLTAQAKRHSANIHFHHINPLVVSNIFTSNSCDYVICYAPSSGLAQMFKHLDYKYLLNLESINTITLYQQKILQNTHHLVKNGGYYIYITNTLNHDENEKQIRTFLKINPQYHLILEKKMLPDSHQIGYYFSILQKDL